MAAIQKLYQLSPSLPLLLVGEENTSKALIKVIVEIVFRLVPNPNLKWNNSYLNPKGWPISQS